jgi:hypothetical protein
VSCTRTRSAVGRPSTRPCGSFEEVSANLSAATGNTDRKRQVEELAARAAQDFDDFYAAREAVAEETSDLLVLTFDGKGIPMLRAHLRPETRRGGGGDSAAPSNAPDEG